MNIVEFDEVLPNGKYMGKWEGFYVTVTIEDRKIKGKSDVGVPKEDGFRFCVVTVDNGKATMTHAI